MARTKAADSSPRGATLAPWLPGLVAHLERLDRLADLGTLHRLLEGPAVTRDDLEPYVRFAPGAYQCNRIGASEWYELVCQCWLPGQCTPIHDHAGSSCAFRVIEGIATETRFERTASGLVRPLWTRRHQPGYVCASEEADIQQVGNTEAPGEELVTLHVYSPRHQGFNVFSCPSGVPAFVRSTSLETR